MNSYFLSKTKTLFALAAGLALSVGIPISASAYDDDRIKRVKVKDHKVKVKVIGGKAKIKHKRNGKEKRKVKGYNGQLAAAIADEAQLGAGGIDSLRKVIVYYATFDSSSLECMIAEALKKIFCILLLLQMGALAGEGADKIRPLRLSS